jgi:hypothetical protein
VQGNRVNEQILGKDNFLPWNFKKREEEQILLQQILKMCRGRVPLIATNVHIIEAVDARAHEILSVSDGKNINDNRIGFNR